MQREADLAGELGERLVVVLAEWHGAVGPPDDEQPEQLAGVRHGRDPQDRVALRGDEGRQPHPRPRRTRHAGARDDRLLLAAERDRCGALVGHGHGALESPGRARPHLGDVERHRLLERLGELEEELVERQRARQAAPERPQHLVGRVPFPVDPARRPLRQPLPRRHPEERGDRGGQHRETEQRPLPRVGRTAQAQHDEQVGRTDQPDEPGERDRVDEQAVDPHRRATPTRRGRARSGPAPSRPPRSRRSVAASRRAR